MATSLGPMKWDPKNLEIRTLSVQRTIEPLLIEVTTLMNTKSPSRICKGKSVKGQILVGTLQKAIENFVVTGEEIANENPDINQEMLVAVDDVKKTGVAMTQAAKEFANDPFSSVKRANMIRHARGLLSAVTHLLILADMVDVHRMLTSLQVIKSDLEKIQISSTPMDLVESLQTFCSNTSILVSHASKRQAELKDASLRDNLAAARSVLQKYEPVLLTSTNVFLKHSNLQVAQENRNYVLNEIQCAVKVMSDIAQGKSVEKSDELNSDSSGRIALMLSQLDKISVMDRAALSEHHTQLMLERNLEAIIKESAVIANSFNTRPDRKERIISECNMIHQHLQEVFTVNKNRQSVEEFQKVVHNFSDQTRSLHRQLRKAVLDHISDTFLETSVPVLALVEVAKSGNQTELEDYIQIFTEHANKMINVANMSCSISNNNEGIKMVSHANSHIGRLYKQVINAARIMVTKPTCHVALQNMEAFKRIWDYEITILTDAIDDIMIIDDFLEVSETHILEDVNKCVQSLQEANADHLDRTAGAIRGRTIRICNVVESEMDSYEPGVYTERVIEAASTLKHQVMPSFAQQVELAVQAISCSTLRDIDENEFIDASRLVYDSVREVRKAVLMNRTVDELEIETDIEYEDTTYDTKSKSSIVVEFDEFPEISGISNTRDAYRLVSEEEKQQIAAQVETFRCEKSKFDKEVAKWDDTGNDIIVIAKQMCMIMMEMTDFTRGKGPLKTTMDVINAAKKISGYGTKLDKLTRQIADLCPESSTKKDLLAYLQRIALYCHQLNITSKVKADVQYISGNIVVSGIDSATSLIQAAKNLMNAVVLTVKASYVASTKYPRSGPTSSLLIVWKMKVPEKKPLLCKVYPDKVVTSIRKNVSKN